MFRSVARWIEKPLKTGFVILILGYQKLISPCLGPRCRFYPSCSSYCLECFKSHHFIIALWLSSKRLLKCQPWHSGGYDPVPEKRIRLTRNSNGFKEH